MKQVKMDLEDLRALALGSFSSVEQGELMKAKIRIATMVSQIDYILETLPQCKPQKKLVLVGKTKDVMGQLTSFVMAYGDMSVKEVVEDWEEANEWNF